LAIYFLFCTHTIVDHGECCSIAWCPLGGDSKDTFFIKGVQKAVVWDRAAAVEGKTPLNYTQGVLQKDKNNVIWSPTKVSVYIIKYYFMNCL